MSYCYEPLLLHAVLVVQHHRLSEKLACSAAMPILSLPLTTDTAAAL
jgi:hypothetical protein